MNGFKANLTFWAEAEGGRSQPVMAPHCYGGGYRPHIVLGDPGQREPICKPGTKEITEDYLGVDFWEGPEKLPVNEPFTLLLRFSYPGPGRYDAVQPGATFTMREGGKVIAFGEVIEMIEVIPLDEGRE